jgi:hypothetical protein
MQAALGWSKPQHLVARKRPAGLFLQSMPALQLHDMLHNLAAREVKQHVPSTHLPSLPCSYRNFQSQCFRNLHGFHLGTCEKYEEPALTMNDFTIDLTEKSAVEKIPIRLIFPKLYETQEVVTLRSSQIDSNNLQEDQNLKQIMYITE